jgi:Glycosyltransferases involved in cell wall biogenesis
MEPPIFSFSDATSHPTDFTDLDTNPDHDPVSAPQSADALLCGRDSEESPVLSVVLPTLNEEAGIETCMQWIRDAVEQLQVPTEIILSDSSTDRTPEIAREYGAIVVTPDGKGYGYAYRYAFERARGAYLVMGDADTTYDFREIPRLMGHLKETGADMVIGSRLDGEIRDGSMPALHKHVGNPLLTSFLNLFYDAGVSDAHSGFRVFTRETLDKIAPQTDGMEFASELIMEAGEADLQIEEVPIVYHERTGEETLDSFSDGWRHIRFMLVNAPGYLFSAPGLLVTLFGVAIMTGASIGIPVSGISLGTNSMIAGSLGLVLGTQIMLMGVLATTTGDPIQQPTSVFTRLVTDHATLERGATLGVIVFGGGVAYALWLVVNWMLTGFGAVPFTTAALGSFTAVVIGAQVTFSSFLLSCINR